MRSTAALLEDRLAVASFVAVVPERKSRRIYQSSRAVRCRSIVYLEDEPYKIGW